MASVMITVSMLAPMLLSHAMASGQLPFYLTELEVKAFDSLLEKQLLSGNSLHVVEFGGGGSTVHFSESKAVISWTAINSNLEVAVALKTKFEGSSKVAIQAIPADFSSWGGTHYDQIGEEGSFAEYESYVQEIQFFGEKLGTSAYWVANFGKARVDVGIAALPLLAKTGGVLLVPDWDRPCYSESLLQFYDLDALVGSLAVLRPKHHSHLVKIQDEGNTYNWCFSWGNGKKTIRKEKGPADTGGVIQVLEKQVGCQDLGGQFDCEEGGCLSCYAALMAASKRGTWVQKALGEVVSHARARSEL
jgi:hypothetical protein